MIMKRGRGIRRDVFGFPFFDFCAADFRSLLIHYLGKTQ